MLEINRIHELMQMVRLHRYENSKVNLPSKDSICRPLPLSSKLHQNCLRPLGVVAPKGWHDLPDSVRYSDSITSFKKNLKTYLYNQAFTS